MEVLVYENITTSVYATPKRSTQLDVAQQADHRLCPHWHWIVLWVSCAGNVLLIVAMILIGIYDPGCSAKSRSPQNPEEMAGIPNTLSCSHLETERNGQLEAFRSCVRQHLCEVPDAFKENRSCNVCPGTWLPYEEKCYWISTSFQSWDQSYKDCAAKGSQLFVISSIGEQEFIQNKTIVNTWIGLTFKLPEEKWMWINGSPLNQTLSRPLKAACGIIGKKGIDSDLCSTELSWICQKPSVFI